MNSLNRSILAGRLIADPVIRYTSNETAVANFQIAINRSKDKSEAISCLAFGGLAKIVGEYLKKGKLVALEGRLQIRSYEDRAGKKKSTTEIIVDELQMLDSKFDQAKKKERSDTI